MSNLISSNNGGTNILEMINLEYVVDGVFTVYFKKKKIGSFVIQDDGYYGYYTTETSGYWSSYALRGIADALDNLNKGWDEQIKKELGDEK